MTAHYSFGARKAAAPLIMGSVLLVLALVFGDSLSRLLVAFPIPILAGLLSAAGLLHITLLRDLRTSLDWLFAVAVGIVGFEVNNIAYAVGGGLVAWWIVRGFERVRVR